MHGGEEIIKKSKSYQSAAHGDINVKLIEVLGTEHGDYYEIQIDFNDSGKLAIVYCEVRETGKNELKLLLDRFEEYDLDYSEYTVAASKAAEKNPDRLVF